MGEVVRPSHLRRDKRLCVQETRLGRVVIFGGLQDHSEPAIGRGQIIEAGRALRDFFSEVGIELLRLFLNVSIGTRQIRQYDRPQWRSRWTTGTNRDE